MLRVFLVDDHEVVRRGVTELLTAGGDIEVVGEAAGVAEALARVPATTVDVAVLDVRLPDGSGVELCRELRSRCPSLVCLMLTSYADEDAVVDAVLAGAAGYVLKDVGGSDLAAAVREVGAGRSLLDTRVTEIVMARLRGRPDDPRSTLTARERSVFDLIGEGLTNAEIGAELFLAEKTVKNHVTSLLDKLGMRRRTQAAVLAERLRGR
ncbi:response regulator transcription factor [Actinomycetospora endophytica]|uniref:Response regulator transcription factor n=1 Tax=Actinomycetospora endophytica TaxID=2291215 RepID=A0ABS8PAD0_9PSEU|nr:response regulator transcription factor [Actinomycetospora endophytica]MCD2195237.1 response regulator transcription factor [Actinomycetospora endophytica]